MNKIIEKDGITSGYVVYDETIDENLEILFTKPQLNAMKSIMTTPKGGACSFDRFCQFIVFTRFSHLGWTMRIIDYHNDVNAALDEYSVLLGKGWGQAHGDKIMSIFQEIEKDKTMIGKMTIKKKHIL